MSAKAESWSKGGHVGLIHSSLKVSETTLVRMMGGRFANGTSNNGKTSVVAAQACLTKTNKANMFPMRGEDSAARDIGKNKPIGKIIFAIAGADATWSWHPEIIHNIQCAEGADLEDGAHN